MRFLFLQSGIWGFLILFSFVLILVLSIVFIFIKRKELIVLIIIMSFVPVIIGGIGCILGYINIYYSISAVSEVTEELIREGKKMARFPLIMGGIFSIPLIIINSISSIMKFKKK